MPQLAVRDIVMQFPAVRALDGVSLTFETGEIHGIVGENGAGKSTLMKILSGLQPPTEGTIELNGTTIHLHGVRDAFGRGIAMIHQELNLVDELTVAENIFLGREHVKFGLLNQESMRDESQIYLTAVHAPFSPATRVGELSIAGKQLVEIAKALAYKAEILIMDEPTAVLSEPEAEALFALIARLKADGVTVLYISHRLVEVCRICDRITVLRDGKFVKTVDAKDSNPTDLASAMVGRPLTDVFPPKTPAPSGEPILEVKEVEVLGWVHGISLSVRPGEILGLAGLVGSGRTELAEALVGARPLKKGTLLMNGHPVKVRSPKDAMKHGLAYVSEDRKALGLILSMSVTDNTTLANLDAYARPTLNAAREREVAERWKQQLDTRVGDLDAPILFLSGGNQQKVSIAKWLDTKPKVIILDEPTRGVDVGAKREMYALIAKLAQEGLACIVISSEMSEIIGLCHRAIVVREGRVSGELAQDELSEEAIMHLAAGVDSK